MRPLLLAIYLPTFRPRFIVFLNKYSPIIFTEGAALMMSASSRNTIPAITRENWDKKDKSFKPKPSSRIMVSKIALIITHMVGPAPLPCPLP